MEEPKEVDNRFMEFSLGKEQFAIPILNVQEVIKVPEVSDIPKTPSYIIGIMNLRGKVITVLDLRKKLSITPHLEKKEEATIILSFEKLTLAVIVDSINRVVSIEAQDMQFIPELNTSIQLEYIKTVYHNETGPVLILDILKALDLSDYDIIEEKN